MASLYAIIMGDDAKKRYDMDAMLDTAYADAAQNLIDEMNHYSFNPDLASKELEALAGAKDGSY